MRFMKKNNYLFGGRRSCGVLPKFWAELQSAGDSNRRQRSHQRFCGIACPIKEITTRQGESTYPLLPIRLDRIVEGREGMPF